jgi:hypothetical protein
MVKNIPMSWRWYWSLFNPPSEAARQRWQKTKVRGKKSFALRVGVLGWGGLMVVVMTTTSLASRPHRQTIDYVFEIAINLLIWPIAGYFFGRSMWDAWETYFGEQNQQRPPSRSGSK